MSRELIEVVREFTGALLNPFDVGEVLHELTVHSLKLLGGSGCGIMLESAAGDLAFAAATSDEVLEIERHQEQAHEGACYEAYSSNEIVAIEDVADISDRWPVYAARLDDARLGSVLGVPLNAFAQTIGVINIYRSEPGPWTQDDIEAAEIIASLGAGYVIYGNDLREQQDVAKHLQSAIDSRDLIGQAKGIIMAREGVSADEAFTLLRRRSQQDNAKLRDVATRVVDSQAAQNGDR